MAIRALQLLHGMARKYLTLLLSMSFPDRGIWRKLFTPMFLVMLYRLPLSSNGGVGWIVLCKLMLGHTQEKSFDRASFPGPSVTRIAEESKC